MQPIQACVEIRCRCDKRRRQHDVRNGQPVPGHAAGIADDALFHRGAAQSLGERGLVGEALASFAIGNEFDGREQAATSDVADVGVICESLTQPSQKRIAQRRNVIQQVIPLDDRLHGRAGGASGLRGRRRCGRARNPLR